MEKKGIKVLDLKEELNRYREYFLEGEKWYLGSESLDSDKTMEQVRDELLRLQFYKLKKVGVDSCTLHFWQRFLQEDAEARMELVRTMLLSMPIGGTGIVDLRIEARINKHSLREKTSIRAVLHNDNMEDEKGHFDEIWTVYDKYHYETVLWDGPIDQYKEFPVPTLPEYSHGYKRIKRRSKTEEYQEAWANGTKWLTMIEHLFGRESRQTERLFNIVFGHLINNMDIGQILIRNPKSGRHRTIGADRYFDETGKAYSPEKIYALRLYIEVEGKLPVIEGWETKDTKRAISQITPENPIIYVPAYNMKWNDDIAIHSSLLNGVSPGISNSVVDIV